MHAGVAESDVYDSLPLLFLGGGGKRGLLGRMLDLEVYTWNV